MEIIATKSKELQKRTLIEAIIGLALGLIVLGVEIACLIINKWRGLWDISYFLLILACFGFCGWSVWQFIEMMKSPDDLITLDEGKVTFSGVLTAETEDVEELAFEISEESKNKDWGTLYFKIDEKSYNCPLISGVQAVYEKLLELGAKAKEVPSPQEEKAEEVAEEAVAEIAAEEVKEESEE